MLNKLTNKILSRVGTQVFNAKQHGPEIGVALGVVAMAGAAVLLARAHKRADIVHEDHELMLDQAHTMIEETKAEWGINLTQKQVYTVLTPTYVKYGVNLVKLYGPPIVLGLVGAGLIVGAHRIQDQRIKSFAAAALLVQQGFDSYRKRVVAELGRDADTRFLWGLTAETETQVVDEDGKLLKRKVTVNKKGDDLTPEMYNRRYGPYMPTASYDADVNAQLLWSVQSMMQDILDRQGWLSLNNVYKTLGFQETSYGQVVGWVKGKGDGFVSFGLDDPINSNALADQDWLLSFNVYGVMWDQIGG